jgi:O-antigen/teichoic acid export membrane protein
MSQHRHRRAPQHRRWLSNGAWAVADQAVYALTNFAVSVLLARWLSQTGYGAFAVAYSVLLLMGTVHSALLTEPMLVLGPSRYPGRTPAYMRRLARLHFILTSAMGVVLLIVVGTLALLEPRLPAATALVALAVSAPGILFLWLARRACYVDSHTRLAASAATVYAVLVPAGILLLWQAAILTPGSAMLTMGVASLLAGWWVTLRLVRSTSEQIPLAPLANVTRAHWSYGRWALGVGLLSWIPPNAVVLALPLWHSLEDAGKLRVATTIILPMLHVYGALGPLLTPALVRARLSGRLRPTAGRAMALFVGLGVGYAPIVLIFGSPIVELLFGPEYAIGGATVWLLALIPLFTGVFTVSGDVLASLERLNRVLWSFIAAAAVTLLIGLPLVFAYGVDGALTSMLLSAATTAVLSTYASRRSTAALRQSPDAQRRSRPDEPAPEGASGPDGSSS